MAGDEHSPAPVGASEPVVCVVGLTKRFGGTVALRQVHMSVAAGEIHAFLGANGAGKSTLIKILAGVHEADDGHASIRGRPLREALEAGRIAFVHQDLGLIDSMSVGENMAMAYGYLMRRGFIDWRAVDATAASTLDGLGWPLPLDRTVGELSQAEKSIVAIARALTRNIDVLVLDEPTSSLPAADVGRLFDALRRLRNRDIGIIYVTHRLDEVFRLADAVTVLRDGQVAASYACLDALTPNQLVNDIVGKAPVRTRAVDRGSRCDPEVRILELCAGDVGPVSFDIGPGEILGMAGLRGQGHERVGRVIAGLETPSAGAIEVGGRSVRFADPEGAIAVGIGFASSKRVEESIATTMSVRENLFLNPLNFGRRDWSLSSRRREQRAARQILQAFDVRPNDPERDISTLSGGNQQKVVLARLAGRGYRILVLEEPTIGVDIGAKSEIYRILAEGAAAGTPCLVISSDLDELSQICHRVLAFCRGRIVAELDRSEITVEALTHAIGGAMKPAIAL